MSLSSHLPPFTPSPARNIRPRNFSVTEASGSLSTFEFGGRSYVGTANRASTVAHSPVVFSGVDVHEQTANLANIGVTDEDSSDESSKVPSEDGWPSMAHEDTNLLGAGQANYTDEPPSLHNPFKADSNDLETGLADFVGVPPAASSQPSTFHQNLMAPVRYLPAVFLGTLLNILDGLSYGMIMFPIGESVFSSLGPSGLSMFYVSCIVSQLVYSLGGSAFKSGIGSEMIEVTPFFHLMALSIMLDMRTTTPDGNKDAIIATTIVTYAVSSIVTGLVFFLLGKLRLGALVGFFPRHILVGCIGGVGYFLVVTGIEVSSRLEGGLEYNLATFKYLFYDTTTLLEWTVPLFLAIMLIALQHRFHSSLVVPLFFILVFVVFHIIVAAVTGWDLQLARDHGWVFPAVEDNEPWYGFYGLYRFSLVDWVVVLRQFPSMLALTFFGILHVPINVPALAVTVGMDQFDVDRELVAHGYSNALSGLLGSIQNYLVYTNSVLFIRAGADERLAGILLAVATGAVMVVGPVVIGYIPVCVVGSLIYLLGYELLKESIFDTWGRLRRVEYSTVIIIVVVMGAWDFVYGILAGILLACLSFVIEAARTPVVSGMYTGVVARSTVLRHPKQQEFLKDVGDQICVVKLQGTVFFGLIGGVEKAIRARFEDDKFNANPVKFLILDMKGVVSVDFSAAEGFRRILNLLNEFDTQLVISSVTENDAIVIALRDAGLWENDQGINLFHTLNYALEWCENSFLETYRKIRRARNKSIRPISGGRRHISPEAASLSPTGLNNSRLIISQVLDGTVGTPRTTQVYQAASRTVRDEQNIQNRYYNAGADNALLFTKEPLSLIMITFSGLSTKDELFWLKLTPYFQREKIPANTTFYDTAVNSAAFFIVESGLIRSICKFESDDRELHSSILPRTAFGDLYDKGSHPYRDTVYTTVNDTVVWKLAEAKVAEMVRAKAKDSKNTVPGMTDEEAIYNELLVIQTKLVRERFDAMTANLVISA